MTIRIFMYVVAKLSGKYRADLYELLRKHNLDPDKFRK
jgi:hypothetical protein